MPAEHYRKDWERFDRENPHVYRALRKICVDARRRGIRRFGIRTVWERLRWLAAFHTDRDGRDWKLNDHYTAFYARKLMAETPELDGFFEVRDRAREAPSDPEQPFDLEDWKTEQVDLF